jgi:hypothetical protein
MWLTPWITFLVIYSFRNHFLQNRFLLFVSVLAIVLLTYQSIVGWIFILYSLKLLYSNSLTRSNLRLYPTMMICFFISLILASFCSITFLRGFGYIEFNERVRLITFSEIPSKVFWFVTRPVVIVFRFFQIDSPSPNLALVTAIPIMGVIYFLVINRLLKRQLMRSSFLISIFIFFNLLFLSNAHLLFSPNNQFDHRMIQSSSFGLMYIFLTELGSFKRIQILMLFVLSCIAILNVNANWKFRYYDAYTQKNMFISESIKNCTLHQREKGIFVVGPDIPFPQRGNIGDFSIITDLQSPWVLEGAIFSKMGDEDARSLIHYIEKSHYSSQSFACKINLEDFRRKLIAQDLS